MLQQGVQVKEFSWDKTEAKKEEVEFNGLNQWLSPFPPQFLTTMNGITLLEGFICAYGTSDRLICKMKNTYITIEFFWKLNFWGWFLGGDA